MFTGFKDKLLQIKESLGGRQFLAILLFLVVLFAIPLTVYLVKQRQELRSKATAGRTVSLEFASVPSGVTRGGSLVLDVVVSSPQTPSSLSGVDFTVTYDPSILTLASFAKNTGSSDPLASDLREEIWSSPNPLSSTGTFRYIAVNKDGNLASKNRVKLGTLTFQVAAGSTAANTTLSFGNVSQLVVIEDRNPYSAASSDENQRLGVVSATINMADPQTPACDATVVCDDSESACTLTGTGQCGAGTKPCRFTTRTAGGTCAPTTTTSQVCTRGCSAGQTCTNGTCSTPAGRMAGDADDNRCANTLDKDEWRIEFRGNSRRCADWNGDQRVDSTDFNLWYDAFYGSRNACVAPPTSNCTNQ